MLFAVSVMESATKWLLSEVGCDLLVPIDTRGVITVLRVYLATLHLSSVIACRFAMQPHTVRIPMPVQIFSFLPVLLRCVQYLNLLAFLF